MDSFSRSIRNFLCSAWRPGRIRDSIFILFFKLLLLLLLLLLPYFVFVFDDDNNDKEEADDEREDREDREAAARPANIIIFSMRFDTSLIKNFE
jgi:hypothetical protein